MREIGKWKEYQWNASKSTSSSSQLRLKKHEISQQHTLSWSWSRIRCILSCSLVRLEFSLIDKQKLPKREENFFMYLENLSENSISVRFALRNFTARKIQCCDENMKWSQGEPTTHMREEVQTFPENLSIMNGFFFHLHSVSAAAAMMTTMCVFIFNILRHCIGKPSYTHWQDIMCAAGIIDLSSSSFILRSKMLFLRSADRRRLRNVQTHTVDTLNV